MSHRLLTATLLAALLDGAILKMGSPTERLRLHYELGRAWLDGAERTRQKAAREHLAKAAALSRAQPSLFELT